jgi:1-acyl-sn-glycerol-3-phosphate acyltransferase
MIADKDTYITDPGRPRTLLSRIFLSPEFMFYPQFFCIVWTNSRRAKKGLYGSREWADSSLDVMRALENVGVRIEITGMDNMKKFDGPAVFIGNHMSTLETMVLPCIVQPVKETTFIVKKSLLTMPVFGHVMQSRDPVVVGRVNPREDLKTVLEEGAKKLKAGRSIIVFPQSTRSVVFDPAEFNTLGIKLASRAGVPVVPLALKTDAWGIGKHVKEFGPVDVRKKVYFAFGEPMKVEGRGFDEHEKVVRFIQERLEEWSKEQK